MDIEPLEASDNNYYNLLFSLPQLVKTSFFPGKRAVVFFLALEILLPG